MPRNKIVPLLILIGGIILAVIIFASPTKEKVETGILEGKVTIGPLCPVEPCQVSAEELARTYGARKLLVYRLTDQALVKEVSLDSKGNYKVELSPGTYILKIKSLNTLDFSKDLKEIKIEPGKTIRLDIKIDTGIR